MKKKLIVTSALAFSLLAGSLTAFAAPYNTTGTLPTSNPSTTASNPVAKKVGNVTSGSTKKKVVSTATKPTSTTKKIAKKSVKKTATTPAAAVLSQ